MAGLVLSAVFLWLTLRQVMPGEVIHGLTHHARPEFALPFLVVYTLFFWLKAVRWRLLLAPVFPVSTRQIFPAILIGYAGNLLFPMQFGELLRTYVLGNQLRVRNSPVIATIALERMFDLVVVALLFAGVLVTSSQNEFPSLRLASYVTAGVTLALLGMVLLYVYRTDGFLGYCRRATRFLPAALQEYLLLQLEQGAQGLETIRSPSTVWRVLALSLAMWTAMAAAVYVAIVALEIDVPPAAAVVALIFTVIGFMLPSSPGYVGTVQLGFLLALIPYGVSSDEAVAASIFYHVLITVPPLLLALVVSMRLGYTPWRLWRLADATVAPQTAPVPLQVTSKPAAAAKDSLI